MGDNTTGAAASPSNTESAQNSAGGCDDDENNNSSHSEGEGGEGADGDVIVPGVAAATAPGDSDNITPTPQLGAAPPSPDATQRQQQQQPGNQVAPSTAATLAINSTVTDQATAQLHQQQQQQQQNCSITQEAQSTQSQPPNTQIEPQVPLNKLLSSLSALSACFGSTAMARGGGIGGGGLTVGPGVVIGDQSAATSGIGIVSGNGTGMGAANVSESGAAEQEQEQVQQVMVQDKPVQVCSKIPIVTDLQVPVTSDMRVGDFISLLQDKVRSSIPLPSGSGDDLVEIVPKISLFVPDLRNACSLDTKISELMKGNDVILEMIPESEWVRTQSAQDLKPLEIEIAPDPVASGAEASYSVNNPESALHESPQQQPEAPPPRRGRGRGRKKTTGDSDNPDTPKPRRGRGSGSASAAAAASSSEWTQQQWSQQQMQQHWQTQTQSQSQSQSQQGQWGSQEDYSPRKRQPSENSPITDLNGDPEEPDRKQLRTVSNMSCHRCKTRRPKCMVCPKNEKHKFCYACMERHHSTTRIPDVGCPVCTRTCTCAQCRKKV